MADRMPRPPEIMAGNQFGMYAIRDYLNKLADSMDRAVREQELKIHKLEQELQKLKKEDDQK